MSDLSFDAGVDLEAPRKLELVHPVTGEPLTDDKGEPFWLMVVSGASDRFQRKAHEIRGRYAIKAKNNPAPYRNKLTYEQEQRLRAEIYAATLTDWRIGRKHGEPALDVPFSWDNAVNWCLANKLLRDQILAVSDDLSGYMETGAGNFTTESSRSSTRRSDQKSG